MILVFTKRNLQPGVTALTIQGSIHCGPECARLEQEVDALIAAHETRVIFDLAGVTHADSAAIGALVRCLSKLKRAGGALRIAAAQTMINYSLKLTKVDQLIEMFPTVDQAAHGFSPSASVPGASPTGPA
jgi:anti-anti-sigma factor